MCCVQVEWIRDILQVWSLLYGLAPHRSFCALFTGTLCLVKMSGAGGPGSSAAGGLAGVNVSLERMEALEEYVKTASMTAGTCAGEVDVLTLRVAALEELAASLAKQLEKVSGAVKDLSKLTPGGDSVPGIEEVEFFDTDGFAPCQVKDDEVAKNPDEAGLSPAQKAQNSLPPNAMLKLSSDGLRPADASRLLAESRTFTRTTGKRVSVLMIRRCTSPIFDLRSPNLSVRGACVVYK